MCVVADDCGCVCCLVHRSMSTGRLFWQAGSVRRAVMTAMPEVTEVLVHIDASAASIEDTASAQSSMASDCDSGSSSSDNSSL